jgi:hypothetical protein
LAVIRISTIFQFVGNGEKLVPDILTLTVAAVITDRYGGGHYVCSSAKGGGHANLVAKLVVPIVVFFVWRPRFVPVSI